MGAGGPLMRSIGHHRDNYRRRIPSCTKSHSARALPIDQHVHERIMEDPRAQNESIIPFSRPPRVQYDHHDSRQTSKYRKHHCQHHHSMGPDAADVEGKVSSDEAAKDGGDLMPVENAVKDRPYREQGNPVWYSSDSIRLRRNLRNNAVLCGLLEMFWDSCTSRIGRDCEFIRQPQYVALHMRMTKALSTFPQCERKFDFHASWQMAIEDWQRDAGMKSTMSRETFLEAIFEVIDIWTVSLEADEYISFARTLLHRTTRTVFAEVDEGSALVEQKLVLRPLSDVDGSESGLSFYAVGDGPVLTHQSLVYRPEAISSLPSSFHVVRRRSHDQARARHHEQFQHHGYQEHQRNDNSSNYYSHSAHIQRHIHDGSTRARRGYVPELSSEFMQISRESPSGIMQRSYARPIGSSRGHEVASLRQKSRSQEPGLSGENINLMSGDHHPTAGDQRGNAVSPAGASQTIGGGIMHYQHSERHDSLPFSSAAGGLDDRDFARNPSGVSGHALMSEFLCKSGSALTSRQPPSVGEVSETDIEKHLWRSVVPLRVEVRSNKEDSAEPVVERRRRNRRTRSKSKTGPQGFNEATKSSGARKRPSTSIGILNRRLHRTHTALARRQGFLPAVSAEAVETTTASDKKQIPACLAGDAIELLNADDDEPDSRADGDEAEEMWTNVETRGDKDGGIPLEQFRSSSFDGPKQLRCLRRKQTSKEKKDNTDNETASLGDDGKALEPPDVPPHHTLVMSPVHEELNRIRRRQQMVAQIAPEGEAADKDCAHKEPATRNTMKEKPVASREDEKPAASSDEAQAHVRFKARAESSAAPIIPAVVEESPDLGAIQRRGSLPDDLIVRLRWVLRNRAAHNSDVAPLCLDTHASSIGNGSHFGGYDIQKVRSTRLRRRMSRLIIDAKGVLGSSTAPPPKRERGAFLCKSLKQAPLNSSASQPVLHPHRRGCPPANNQSRISPPGTASASTEATMLRRPQTLMNSSRSGQLSRPIRRAILAASSKKHNNDLPPCDIIDVRDDDASIDDEWLHHLFRSDDAPAMEEVLMTKVVNMSSSLFNDAAFAEGGTGLAEAAAANNRCRSMPFLQPSASRSSKKRGSSASMLGRSRPGTGGRHYPDNTELGPWT